MAILIKRNWIKLVVLLLIAVGVIYVYEPLSSGNKGPLDLSDYEDTGLFRIDPGTILTSLEKGKIDIFLLDQRLVEERVEGPILHTEPILWSQSDYLQIVTALDNSVWNSTLDDWSLFSMDFNGDCQNLNVLTGAEYKYFKTDFDKGKVVDTWREIEVNPEYGYVAWGNGARYPHPLLGWKSVDLDRLKVTAEEAIRIAEENGGTEARLKIENRCYIHLSLTPDNYEGWEVDYGYSSGFRILIDPYTGKVTQKFCSFFPDPVEELICKFQT